MRLNASFFTLAIKKKKKKKKKKLNKRGFKIKN